MAAFCLATGSASASFDARAWGARAAGMAGAFTAMADDSSAPFWNPAGSSWIDWLEVGMMWENAYPGLIDARINSGYFSAVWPTQIGSFGAAVSAFQAGGLLRENVFIANYSRKFVKGRAAVGLNFKYLLHDYLVAADASAAGHPVFANGSTQGALTYDLGLTLVPARDFTLGLTGRNLTEPDVGLVDEDRVPSEFQGGLAWQPIPSFGIELDGLYRNTGLRSGPALMLGAENWFMQGGWLATGLRAGVARSLGETQTGAVSEFSTGVSLILGRAGFDVNLDYAYTLNFNLLQDGGGGSASTHRIGLAILFSSSRR